MKFNKFILDNYLQTEKGKIAFDLFKTFCSRCHDLEDSTILDNEDKLEVAFGPIYDFFVGQYSDLDEITDPIDLMLPIHRANENAKILNEPPQGKPCGIF